MPAETSPCGVSGGNGPCGTLVLPTAVVELRSARGGRERRAGMAGGRRRGALEQEVLACLGAAGRPLTVAEVLAEIGGDLAYTTVLTALSRLHAKGALTRQPAGRGYAYALPADPAA